MCNVTLAATSSIEHEMWMGYLTAFLQASDKGM